MADRQEKKKNFDLPTIRCVDLLLRSLFELGQLVLDEPPMPIPSVKSSPLSRQIEMIVVIKKPRH